ncbi:MAG: hypothetical protein ACRC8P_02970 [Spiroplasma sp.]
MINFKKLLTTIGLAAIVVPVSMSVIGCDLSDIGKAGGKNTNEKVVNEINKTIFTYGVAVGISASDVDSSVCVKVIGSQLPANFKKLYNPSLFIKHDITNENGVSLSDSDFQRVRTIKAKILYSYAEFKDQTTNLTIKVVDL